MDNAIWITTAAGLRNEVALYCKGYPILHFVDFTGEMTTWIRENMPELIHYANNLDDIDEYDARGASITDAEALLFKMKFADANRADRSCLATRFESDCCIIPFDQ